ncbi:cation:proton antiporter domain-containing protein [Cellulomonas soli]
MHHVHVFALVAIAVLVAALCRRRGWPAPLVIVAVGLIASFVPGVPRFEIDATVILEFVLPPLLYSAALSSSYRDFRSSWNAITRLGVGLVLVTALAVALVAKAVHPRCRSPPRSSSVPWSPRPTPWPPPPSAGVSVCPAAS